MKKQLGGIESMTFMITSPLEMNFTDISVNNLTILTGMNGTGKSFILASVWAVSYIANIMVQSGMKANLTELAQFVTENTYQGKVTGMIKSRFSSSVSIDIAFEDGKVINITENCLDQVTEATNVQFMSSSFRKFTAISGYLACRKHYSDRTPEERIGQMIKNFRLYDVLYIESLINKCPITDTTKLVKQLENFDMKEPILSVDVDLNECDFYAVIDDKGTRRYFSRWYGSGHQAILNMLIGQL